MFDIGSPELVVLGLVALLVVGPKELPKLLKTVAGFVRQARALAGQFRGGLDQMIREVDIAEERAKAAIAPAKVTSSSLAPESAAQGQATAPATDTVPEPDPSVPAPDPAPSESAVASAPDTAGKPGT